MQSGTRACNNEIEKQTYDKVQDAIYRKIATKDEIDPTYYKCVRETMSTHKSDTDDIMEDWAEKLKRLIPNKAH